jgi:hypothetical protein
MAETQTPRHHQAYPVQHTALAAVVARPITPVTK